LERLGRRGQRLVQLDRVDLLGDVDHGLEQRVELGGHLRHVDHVGAADPLLRRILRRRERHVLVAEHGGRGDVGVDVLRDQVDVLGLDLEQDLGAGFLADALGLDLGDPADLDAVVGHLVTGVEVEAGARGHHRELLARREVTAELEPDQRDHHRENEHQHQAGQLVRRCLGLVDGSGHGYTVRLKFGSVP
jgi:hypothetical protein